MPTIYILVGMPGTGKSTWLAENFSDRSPVICSTDNYIEEYAAAANKLTSEWIPITDDEVKNFADWWIPETRFLTGEKKFEKSEKSS